MGWDEVRDAMLDGATLVAWDGCHKCYVAMDEEQAAWFRENYNDAELDAEPGSARIMEGSGRDMLATLETWFEASCGLRFISAVRTDHDDPNAGFTHLIAQGEIEDEEEEWEEEAAW